MKKDILTIKSNIDWLLIIAICGFIVESVVLIMG